MSIPLRVVVDWEKIRICKDCADKIAGEISKQLPRIRKGEQPQIDLVNILCDECFKINIESNTLKIEIDPKLVRNK